MVPTGRIPANVAANFIFAKKSTGDVDTHRLRIPKVQCDIKKTSSNQGGPYVDSSGEAGYQVEAHA